MRRHPGSDSLRRARQAFRPAEHPRPAAWVVARRVRPAVGGAAGCASLSSVAGGRGRSRRLRRGRLFSRRRWLPLFPFGRLLFLRWLVQPDQLYDEIKPRGGD